jgi:transcriptional regulator with PAS, ATPase and Fis domain
MKENKCLPNWAYEFPGAVTVCDRKGIIVYMNSESKKQFVKYGGEQLLGMNLIDCHPEPSRALLVQMLEEPFENKYITEKNGQKKLVVQAPWVEDGDFLGVVEVSVFLPG